MPKERKDRSVTHERYRKSPLCCESSRALKPSDKQVKEWEEARCPVCMEHPHNGILLICSSYENGCRPYMCDTSHRHSNCFDQYRKASKETEETNAPIGTEDVASEVVSESREGEVVEEVEGEGIVATEEEDQENAKSKLTCPLCRGHIKEWVVEEPARCFMNAKHRSCSSETCEYSGTYSDLRKHARLQHPGVRPSEADPERQRSWRRLERQRDLGDLLSTLQSSFGGGGEERSSNDEGILSFEDGGWLTVFFLIRVFRPESSSGSRRSSSWSGTSRARSQIGVRRRSSRLWGESYEGDTGGTSSRDEEINQSSDEQESGARRRRVRRRFFIEDDDDEEEEET
ncbi:unnamed protein product [Microthlaspi erraticum]|uniref:Uncharacterized protein n=1 Tax=Microthlaspi erraticum TaxID=1685480 RepID=A0A6D2KQW0_9BRAS|nr:unnamed protein product [Microthlaspi erraticum]